MNYCYDDLKNIAKALLGAGKITLPEIIILNETNLYEICYDMQLSTSVIDEQEYKLDTLSTFLKELAETDKLTSFVNYYINIFLENKIDELTIAGYNIFLFKDKILTEINSVWSIEGQEFGIENSKISIKEVEFKQFDKLGVGGFCTVYNSPTDKLRVYKVLNAVEKSDVGSVHRFKREFEIMSKENDSTFTLKVFDFDSKKLVYSMEKAKVSLEDYINTNKPGDQEKDDIVIRCATCMKYLHNHEIIHRDFHPGNILKSNNDKWMLTDFGLAKKIDSKYSHQTTTTHAVGRAWFTDPMQLFALKDGNYKTDMFSLARTIDYTMNENMSGSPHKYSSVVYKATAADPDNRYQNIDEMYEDLKHICGRTMFESDSEIIKKMLIQFDKTKQFDTVQLVSILNENNEGNLLLSLIIEIGSKMCLPFIDIINVSFEIALREIKNVSCSIQESYQNWNDYDTVAYWAIALINERRNKNDEINIEAARIVDYVATAVNRFDIKKASNKMKNNASVDGHIRAELSYHDGY